MMVKENFLGCQGDTVTSCALAVRGLARGGARAAGKNNAVDLCKLMQIDLNFSNAI